MTAQYGPHRWSAGTHDDGANAEHRGASFTVRDLTGARFVDWDLTGVKIVDSWLVGVDISGFVGGLSVNGVDVTAYVEGELERLWSETTARTGLSRGGQHGGRLSRRRPRGGVRAPSLRAARPRCNG